MPIKVYLQHEWRSHVPIKLSGQKQALCGSFASPDPGGLWGPDGSSTSTSVHLTTSENHASLSLLLSRGWEAVGLRFRSSRHSAQVMIVTCLFPELLLRDL
jgi:hypothetical protein